MLVVICYFWWCVIVGSPNIVGWILGVWSWSEGVCGDVRLRAWNVRGSGSVLPSDLVVYCPTGRSVFLRRKAGIEGVTGAMREGSRVHEEALSVWRVAVEDGWEGLLRIVSSVVSVGGLWAVSSVVRWMNYRDLLPVRIEPVLPGWAGFKSGRPDLVVGPYPVELVNSKPDSWSWRRKRLVVAAYSLMLEHAWNSPVDSGFLVSLSTGRVEQVCVDDELRVRLLDIVDEFENFLEEDPGIPESPASCPVNCPYRKICWGGKREASNSEAGAKPRIEEGPNRS